MLPLGSFRRHRQWVLIALLCLILWGAPIDGLHAQPQAILEPKPSEGMGPSLLGILATLGTAIVGVVLLFWRRPGDTEAPQHIAPVANVRVHTPEPSKEPHVSDVVHSVLAVHVAEHQEIERPLFNTSGHGNQKVCLSCRRMYAHWVVVCPVDSTPLSPMILSTHNKKREELDRMRCTSCERRYTMGALHCGHDGEKLSRDTSLHAERAEPSTLCTHCGAESPGHACCDDPEHRTIRPDDMTLPHPMLRAMWCCRTCHAIGAPGDVVCAQDDSPLVPMTALVRHALPHVGYGPRRRVCTSCANVFSASFDFCTFDGSALSDLH